MQKLESSFIQKSLVAITAFSLSSAAFMLAVLIGIPVLGKIAQDVRIAESVQQMLIFSMLILPPIVAAILGLHVGCKIAGSNRNALG